MPKAQKLQKDLAAKLLDCSHAAGRTSSFEVTVNDKLVYSKLSTGRFPDHATLIPMIQAELAVRNHFSNFYWGLACETV